jgi:hypothetical protein
MATFRVLLLYSLAVGCSNRPPQVVEKAVEGRPQAPVTEDDFKILDVVLVPCGSSASH